MAFILLVDPADVAKKAMKGVLARGNHRLATVPTVAEAWDFLQRNLCVDLVFLELKLEGEGGLTLVDRLRNHCFLKLLPVVVYTTVGDRDSVRRAMALKVQNFLVKPYLSEPTLGEVAKALANPWRQRHFEEEKSFCTMMGYTPDGLHKLLDELKVALAASRELLLDAANAQNVPGATTKLGELSTLAESAGAWGVVELLNDLKEKAEQSNWAAFGDALAALPLAERLIFTHLNPELVPEDFISDEERNAAEEARERARWFNAPAEGRCPVVSWPQITVELDGLSGCPVIDSVAASFQMRATGHPSSLAPLMDLAEKDPGLSAHLLVAANRMRSNEEDPEPIENSRLCVGLLGEIKLASMASGLVTTETKVFDRTPCTWTNFWMFQVGVARISRFICQYLEFHSLEARAYSAGLLHDIGKLLLAHLHPVGFHAIIEYARKETVPLSVAEQKFAGCTTREIAVHFAEKHGLLPSYINVMRWVDDPTQATEDAVLVAIVSMARDLCRKNRVGWSGESVAAETQPIAETPEWQVLSQRVFLSFNLEKFEAVAHAECRELKLELQGRLTTARV